jgi:HlyD family secretion protein
MPRFAESEYQRYRELHERGLVSTTDMERAQVQRDRQAAARRAAAYAVEVAGFEVESARACWTLPVVSARPRTSRNSRFARRWRAGAAPSPLLRGRDRAGEPVLDVGSLEDLEVQVDLLSMAAVRVRPGHARLMTGWGGDGCWKVRCVGSSRPDLPGVSALGVEEQRVPVIIDFDGSGRGLGQLGVGYRVEAEFLLWEDDDVLQVPTSALFRTDGDWTVFVVDKGAPACAGSSAGARADWSPRFFEPERSSSPRISSAGARGLTGRQKSRAPQ